MNNMENQGKVPNMDRLRSGDSISTLSRDKYIFIHASKLLILAKENRAISAYSG